MMMWLSLLPLLLLTATPGDASPPLTFTDTDPITGAPLECDRCPPGTYLRARCTSTRKSECAPCPSGSFTELWNYIGKCLRCGVCGLNQVEKTACTATRDCQCQCRKGFYFRKNYDMCLRHSECPAGQEVQTAGTPDEDTVCRTCPNGTYSDVSSAQLNCTEHGSCEAGGQQLLLRGSTWHDSVCVSCEVSGSRDGADYLRQILPAFFVHQKMSQRRLRQIVNKLPSGRRQGRASGLALSDLHHRINAWLTSATQTQIRQLPDILAKAGASGAGEKLQNKLQRIDGRLAELCPGNEVE